jgi:hypothetical protein
MPRATQFLEAARSPIVKRDGERGALVFPTRPVYARSAMGRSINLSELDATAQADLVRRRRVSALELAHAVIVSLECLDGSLNAVIRRRFEKPHPEAMTRTDGMFAGVPLLLPVSEVVVPRLEDPA